MLSEPNILISFAQKDNVSDNKDELGWVSHFNSFLSLMFYQITGRNPNIVLKDDSSSIIPSELENIDFFIAIVSAHFIASQQCLDTLESVQKNELLCKEGRTLKAMKTVVPLLKQPPFIRNVPRYNMYLFDEDPKSQIDFFSPEAKRQYWMEMLDLAYDIWKKINNGNVSHIKRLPTHKTIFLADTNPELSMQRSIIKRELERFGCDILPSISLPIVEEEWKEAVKKNLKKSDFSIHLIGGKQTKTLEGTDQSVVVAQNHLATEQSVIDEKEGQNLCRLIWISPNTKMIKDEQQNSFVETLKRGIDVRDNKTEVSEAPFEDFKRMLWEKLAKSNDSSTRKTNKSKKKIVYTIYDAVDKQTVKPYLDIIEKAGFTVMEPTFEGKFEDIRENHISNISLFDIAIIFKIKVSDLWMQMKILDILKAPGVGRNKPILGKFIVAPEEKIDNLQNFEDYGITLIRTNQGEPSKTIENLLVKLA